ncbi:AAA family ATPase [Rhodothermus marinus]|uniref:ATPase associated with various cellular activities AAA_5 n=1 Tax=Rhodothermus marinus (strain ATCC 43812 / DSM 4252 / R-10) TaxID=518766 RepID=D0MGS5_RHOM4|nr:MoxR family ATPase [Rhodothermus marinus]ACY49638.1 ATPase associated with various cellular activities AAA_5 [Rhodothermus marinus DSM 4252]
MSTEAAARIAGLIEGLEQQGYVADEALATVLYLVLTLRRPLLVEGDAGVGKTEIAYALAGYLDTELIRLQCYEGLDVHSAVYEWNYPRQLLAIKLWEKSDVPLEERERHLFSETYLLARPLLKAIQAEAKAPVLLIDEIDRADEEFEAFLLELLSAFQISIPELGTIRARHIPYVVLTSNRTRELSDALKRRCLYYWLDYPDETKELRIIRKRLPDIETELARQVVRFVQALRRERLHKIPGIAETLDWARALVALGVRRIDEAVVARTAGCLLKSAEDLERLRNHALEALLAHLEA